MKDNTSEIKQDFTLLRKLISEEISKSPNICCNHCCEPNNSKMPHTTTMRCQTIGNENTKIINLNCEPVPVPICFFKCCQSSNPSSSLPTTELRPESARQEMITTDVQCQTECFTPAKESYASIISYARPVPDCFQEINVPLQEPYVSSSVCPQKVCALCCCPVEDQVNYCRENFQNVTVRNPSQKSFNICTENATASCWNHEIPLVATQCMCSPPYKRTSWEKDYGPKPSEVAPKIHMRSTHGILLKSQSTQVGTIEVLDDNRFTINGIPFKSCECGEKAEGKFTIAETVKQPPNKEIESASDRPGSSTSESSTDSQTSRGRRLKSRDWLTKTAEGSTLRKSKKLRSKKERKTKQQGTFTLWIDSMYFPSRTMERLNAMDSKPYVYLTWTFLELEDKAYSTIMPANKAVFNCSSVYRGDITLEMLHYMCANKVKVECHVALNDSSKMISFGEIDVSEAIYKPNTKCKYKVSLDGPNNMSAVLTSRFKFECPENLLRRVLQK